MDDEQKKNVNAEEVRSKSDHVEKGSIIRSEHQIRRE